MYGKLVDGVLQAPPVEISRNIKQMKDAGYKPVIDSKPGYDVLINEDNQLHIYNHKSYNGTNLIEDVNSAVLTNNNNITPMIIEGFEGEGYFRLYEIDKLELDNNCLPKDISIKNSLTVGTRIGDIGIYSVAEGEETTASGMCSHAEGNFTIASSDYQHVQGKYNIEDTENKYTHIVGNGMADTARSNAHTLDWNGNGWYKGKLSQDGTPTEDKDLTTKKYVDDAIASQPQISFDTEGNLVVTIGGVTKKFKEITE